MVEVYGIEFIDNNKIYFFDSNNKKATIGDLVIVETEKGTQIAKIVTSPKKVKKNQYKNLKKIIRLADDEDKKINDENIEDAKKTLKRAEKIAKKLKLNMKFLSANYTFDRNQLFISFTSENRVDFRELAKELASIYKTRIELRQIGIRDKAREISGIGQCGRKLCCSSFLGSIDSVSINMVKNQNLSLNPNKINGQCGRLLCCLNYEDDNYSELRKGMPNIGDEVETEKGKAKVISLNILERKYTAMTEDNDKVEIELKEREKKQPKEKKKLIKKTR